MTVNDIFEITMDLMDERADSGVVDAQTSLSYKVRTPGLINTIFNEILRNAPLYDELEIEKQDGDGYQLLELPENFLSIYQIFDNNLELISDFRVVARQVYVPKSLEGKIIFRIIPERITSLEDEGQFNDFILSTIVPNALAGKLLATENVPLANFFRQIYEEQLAQLKTAEPKGQAHKIDVYNIGGV